MMKDMKIKKKEFEKFNDYVESVNYVIENGLIDLKTINQTKYWIPEEEINNVNERIIKLKEWIQSKIKEREDKPANSDPILTEEIIKTEIVILAKELNKLNKIEKPKPSVNETNKSTEENITNNETPPTIEEKTTNHTEEL